MAYQSRDQIECGIHPRRHSSGRKHPQPSQRQCPPSHHTLPPVTRLPRIAPLPGNALLSPIRPLIQHKRVLLKLLSQVEACVVHDVALLHDIRPLAHISGSGVLAQLLQLRVIVRVRGCGEALQDARLSEEEAARADAEEGAFPGGVLLLEGGPLLDESEGLFVLFEDDVGIAAGDEENVEVTERFVRGLVAHVGFDGDGLVRDDADFGGAGADFEGRGAFERLKLDFESN